MKLRSRPVAIASIAGPPAVALGVVLARGSAEETCFDRLGGPGANSNRPRLETLIAFPAGQWPAVAQLLRDFAIERGWSVQDGRADSDPNYHWTDLCDAGDTIILASNQYSGETQRIGFGIIHMDYQAPGNEDWRPTIAHCTAASRRAGRDGCAISMASCADRRRGRPGSMPQKMVPRPTRRRRPANPKRGAGLDAPAPNAAVPNGADHCDRPRASTGQMSTTVSPRTT